MRALVTVLVFANLALAGCASRRAAVGGVTAAATAAALVGCTLSSSSNCGSPQIQTCPRGYALGIDSRCHREN
jgi:hypothetical protein